jgi:hypothetical protein
VISKDRCAWQRQAVPRRIDAHANAFENFPIS